MTTTREMSPAKRKRLLKTYGSCPAGYTGEDFRTLPGLTLWNVQLYLYPSRTSANNDQRPF